MGNLTFSIPKPLVMEFLQFRPIANFIETGTHRGGTTFWAAQHFPKVYTIEIDEALSHSTASVPGRPSNIEFLVGDSKVVLPQLVQKGIDGNCFFWLDGHWCFDGGGKEEECPLIAELEAIRSVQDSIILIDDARCFLGPLPKPHDSSHWPRIDEVFRTLATHFPNHRVSILDDVILAVSKEYLPVFEAYWQRTFYERYARKSKKSKVLRALKKLLGK